MAKTQISDVIVPIEFSPYVVERTNELSRLVQSGLVARAAEFDTLASGGGTTFPMPFWRDLTGSSEELSDAGALTPAKIQAAQDQARKHFRGKAWASNDLAGYLSGDDPMRQIGDLVASFWMRDMQRTILIPSLQGVFAAALAGTHIWDISAAAPPFVDANLIGTDSVIEAAGRLGDAWEKIVAMTMHSVPFRRLQKLNLIEFVPLADQNIMVPRFLGREVIVDDGMPVAAAGAGFQYTTYLFGAGAIALGEGGPDAEEATETDRDILAGDDVMTTRRHFIMHPRGIAYTGTPAGVSPTAAELANGANWALR